MSSHAFMPDIQHDRRISNSFPKSRISPTLHDLTGQIRNSNLLEKPVSYAIRAFVLAIINIIA